MSLWWARREQLDAHQVSLIEGLPLQGAYLVLGPPGSGKTNVLLRRAQYVRTQQMTNVLVLTFTRPLTEFVKTGCFDAQGREIFPKSCVTTLESWVRFLHKTHQAEMPPDNGLTERKIAAATAVSEFRAETRMPKYDALFVDEAQDLLPQEVEMISQWSNNLFFVGDDRQRIYSHPSGLPQIRALVSPENTKSLPFHYRLAPDLCRVADKILQPQGDGLLAAACHYDGPRPGAVSVSGPLSKDSQINQAIAKLKDQLRVYGDLIRQGDRLGVIVARTDDRDLVLRHLESDPDLSGRGQILRSRDGTEDDDYDPTLDPEVPICILTVAGCKGLEFRAVHWLFCEDLARYHTPEHYYTVVTRAKTTLDIYYTQRLPQELARAHAPSSSSIW
jgi:hypothetical protein